MHKHKAEQPRGLEIEPMHHRDDANSARHVVVWSSLFTEKLSRDSYFDCSDPSLRRVTRFLMTAKLKTRETATGDAPFISRAMSAELRMIAEQADSPVLEQHDPSVRRLRNRIIVANAVVWIAIIALIGLIFF
jgi:hypothetical protein